MNSRILALALTGLIVGASLAYFALSGPAGPNMPTGQTVNGKALVGGPFSLVDHTGRRVTDKDFLGRPMLVFFGYTNCPDICPSGLQVVSAALDKLGDRAKTVQPVFVSIDPARDTPEKLAEYLKSFSPRLIGLTGSAEETAAAAKAYRVFYQKVEDEKSKDTYSMDHSAIFYLMGADGAFITHIPHTTDVDKVVAALNKSLP
jgi:protein SCO1